MGGVQSTGLAINPVVGADGEDFLHGALADQDMAALGIRHHD